MILHWQNEPPAWNADGGRITLTTAPKTDFWRKTHDGGTRDNGHFYHQMVSGDFAAEVKISGQYADLYDQAGLMVRLDEIVWLKCGIELLDGVQQMSAVVTRDFSDWSVIALPHSPPTIWIRLVRHADTIEVYYSLDGAAYTMYRQTHLTSAQAVSVGLMACSPTGNGFPVTFEGFAVREG